MSDAQVTPQLLVTTMPATAKTKPALLATTLSAEGKTKPIILMSVKPISTISVSVDCDTSRNISNTMTVSVDTSREVTNTISTIDVDVDVDLSRILSASISVDCDTSRKISNAITVDVDAERKLQNNVTLDFDTVRQIVQAGISVTEVFDLSRVLSNSVSEDFDTERTLLRSEQVDADTERTLLRAEQVDTDVERKLQNSVTIDFDVERRATRPVIIRPDTERVVLRSTEALFDTRRVLVQSVAFNCDVWRQIPHKVNGNTTTLQSVTISLQEQQLTDNVSFVAAENIEIMEAVDFHVWDYVLRCRAEETSKKGVLLSCKCTVDIDEMLYRQMSYVIPESEWDWTDDYLAKYNKYKIEHEDAEDLKKMPSATASTHINKIANALGLNVSMQFRDWVSTMSTDVKSGTNYAGLISELIGWTSRLPHLMINCYIREDTLYVIQRGHESNTITLDGNKLSVHTVTKKLIRTTWGSEVTSETLVVPYYDEWWMEGEKQPLPEDVDSGYTLDGDGLVKQYVNEYGDGSNTVVTCNYNEDELGRKMLRRETAISSDGDETITVHEPIGINQKKVVTYDEDGILGSTVSPSNMDDRVTPYQSSSTYSDGTIVSDINGNRYLLLSMIYHKEKVDEKRRTVNGIALIDTSFPVDGQAMLEFLTQQIMWLDRKTEESVTLEIYDYPHLIDFNDKIVWHGNTYYLRANTAVKNENIINKQTLEFVRWY